MKISKQIKLLEKVMQEHGDIETEIQLENGTCFYVFKLNEYRVVNIVKSKETKEKELQLIYKLKTKK